MTNSTAGATTTSASGREWIGLATLGLAALAVAIDGFVLLLALPTIGEGLHANSTEQLWMTDVYPFMLAGFLITMGRLGDRVGRRRLLLIGAAAFAIASIGAAIAPTPAALIAARALMGIAGATLAPSTLALISNMFTDPRQRSVGFGIWLTCTMSGAIVGPLLGGIVLARFWWGAVFLIGVPAMILLLILAPAAVPEYRSPRAARIDVASVVLSLAAILPFVYGVKELARVGLAPVPIISVVAGLLFAVLFIVRERRIDEPLLDLTLFSSRRFSAALVGMHLITVTGALMVFVPQYFQLVAGMPPFASGLGTIPAVLSSIAGMLLAPLLARRIRPAYLIAGGATISIIGLALAAAASSAYDVAGLVIGYAIWNAGCSPMAALGTDLVVGSAPAEKAGSAGALCETSSQLGYALGIAVLGSIAALVYRVQLTTLAVPGAPAGAVTAARGTIEGAVITARHLPPGLAAALLVPARAAFTSGMQVVIALIAGTLVGVALLALLFLRHVPAYGRLS